MTELFTFEELLQLATAKVESRAGANSLAIKLGQADGIVQCVRVATSLLDEIYCHHARHEQQIKIASLMRDRCQTSSGRQAPKKR